jgi:hypothetical protein
MLLLKTERHRSPRHLSWLRTLPCSVPGCEGEMIQAHHIRKGAGVALKPSDQYSAPICMEHHAEIHQIGSRTFEVRYQVDLSSIAAKLWMESNRRVTT